MRQSKCFISILILLILGLHALPFLQELQVKTQTLWPFMAWGMYRQSHDSKRPIRTIITRIIGITLKGEELKIELMQWPDFFNLFWRKNKRGFDSVDVGLGHFAFKRLYVSPMRNGDSSSARRLAEWLNLNRDDPIVKFRVENETYTITDAGIIKKADPVVTYRVID